MSTIRRVPAAVVGSCLAALLAVWGTAITARAETPPAFQDEGGYLPDGIHILDGSFVLNAGRLRVNITNHGLIGSRFGSYLPYSNAPSAQWPGGSSHEYLYAAGLWIGAMVNGEISVTTGQPEREMRPGTDLHDTMYEAREWQVTRPEPAVERAGYRLPYPRADDDNDGQFDEEVLNGVDDDGDGAVDEDFGQMGNQMFVCTMFDDTPLVREIYPDHRPLGAKIVQRAVAWEDTEYENMVALDFEITNRSGQTWKDAYLGFYVDCDIRDRSVGLSEPDDITGYFNGVMRDDLGTYHRLQIGWMRDAAADDPLPGVIGAMVLDHTTDFTRYYAPNLVRLRTYQNFKTGATLVQSGEPLIDVDRYELMGKKYPDPDRPENDQNDWKFLLSSGPFGVVPSGKTLNYRVAMVLGRGMEDMLRNALAASVLQRGVWADKDLDYQTPAGGETRICIGDLEPTGQGDDRIFWYRPAIPDVTCTGTQPRIGYQYVTPDDLIYYPDIGKHCYWFNADNCEECFRREGQECTVQNDLYWSGEGRNPYAGTPTGGRGREHRVAWWGGGEFPPTAPAMRVMAGDNRVEVLWDDSSEFEPDYLLGVLDFESYRVWRVTDWKRDQGVDEDQQPPDQMWGMIDEWDVQNVIPAGAAGNSRDLELGRNTGLEKIRYAPPCLVDPAYAGLAEAMQVVVDRDSGGDVVALPPLRYPSGNPRPGFEELLLWEGHPAVLDTFFAVAAREEDPAAGVVAKRGTRYYHHTDTEVHNGFRAFYAVTARDHRLTYLDDAWVPAGYGIEFEPGSNYVTTMPRTDAQTVARRHTDGQNIYVYPNPVTREALAEFDLQYPTTANPTGSQIRFANLPAGRNLITIYTASGDLVESIRHDGNLEGGETSWNLVSRNGQEVVSGIYLWAVESDDPGFDNVTGRFVVIW